MRAVFVLLVVCCVDFNMAVKFSARLNKVKDKENDIFARDVLRTVDRTLEALGDFSSLNENYLQTTKALEEMNQFFRGYSLPGLSFDMQTIESWNGELGDVYMSAFQINIGLFDIQENQTYVKNDLRIERKLDAFDLDVLEVWFREEHFYCMAFSMNIVVSRLHPLDCNMNIYYVNSFTSTSINGDDLILRINSTEKKCMNLVMETILKLNSDWIRIHIDMAQADVEFTSNQLLELEENTIYWLEYTSLTYVYRFTYALLDMTREQLLSSDLFDANSPSIVSNIILLNQQNYIMQKQIALLPHIESFGYNDFQANKNSISVRSETLVDYVPNFNIEYIPNEDVIKKFTFSPKQNTGRYYIGKAYSNLQVPFLINIAQGVIARGSLILTCDWEFLPFAKFFLTLEKSRLYSEGYLKCDVVFGNELDVLFNNALSLPYDIRDDATLVFEMKYSVNTFGLPTALSMELNGNVAYGLKFQKIKTEGYRVVVTHSIHTDIYEDIAITIKTMCLNPCLLVQDGKGWPNFENYFKLLPIPLFKKTYSDTSRNCKWHSNLDAYRKEKTDSYIQQFEIAFLPEKSNQVEVIAKVPRNRIANTLPFNQLNSLSILAIQLNMLSNEVAALDERVGNLEAAVFQTQHSFAWFLTNSLNILDFAFNAAEMAKVLIPVQKHNRNTLKRLNYEDKNPLAKQFEEKTKTSKKATTYSILEAADSTSQVNILQNHKKNYFYQPAASKISPQDVNLKEVLNNKKDIREVMELNSVVYSKVQTLFFDSLGKQETNNYDFTKQPFGLVTIHKSPIEVPIGKRATKYISSHNAGTQSGRAFLSNDQQRFPFHTSVSSSVVEIRNDNKVVLNTRFTGIAEPSIIGPTNAKNPRVKIGYVKVQHEIITFPDDTSTLKLIPWHNTEITPGVFYKSEDVDYLYSSFFPKQKMTLSQDQKWELIAHKTTKKINSRNSIDSVPLQSNIFLGTLDELMFFSKEGGNFKYDLLNNNCQTYARAFAQLATNGNTQMDLIASDFRDFAQRVATFAEKYFQQSPAMQKSITFIASTQDIFQTLTQYFNENFNDSDFLENTCTK